MLNKWDLSGFSACHLHLWISLIRCVALSYHFFSTSNCYFINWSLQAGHYVCHSNENCVFWPLRAPEAYLCLPLLSVESVSYPREVLSVESVSYPREVLSVTGTRDVCVVIATGWHYFNAVLWLRARNIILLKIMSLY
jgi:hypothetical protein